MLKQQFRGRGALVNPVNRFEKLDIEVDPEWLEHEPRQQLATEYYADTTRDILAKNDSPDLSFDYGLNPYRGCEHGCVYCYARPSHEFLGWSAGLDFESKILVKPDAPRLLEAAFRKKSWQPQVVALSGNTDCYQPVERELQLTRQCLEVFHEFRNPVSIITKNALVTRDIDLLSKLAKRNLVIVTLSVTSLHNKLARLMEPRTSVPLKRLDALEQLTRAGIPTNVNVAPVIPGLNDVEISSILKAASERGVRRAAYILLRLPYSVKEIFFSWLEKHFPDRVEKVMHAVQDTRAGRLNDPCFGSRMKGEGVRADMISRVFELSCRKFKLNQVTYELSTEHFRRTQPGQIPLF